MERIRRTTGRLPLLSLVKKLKRRLTAERLEHSLSVADTACFLAKVHGLSVEKAYIAGLLHDVARDMPYRVLLVYARKSHIPVGRIELEEPVLLHAPVGAEVARREFGVTDEYVLKAISRHTTGCPGMSALDLVLYVADYIEPRRRFGGFRGDSQDMKNIRVTALEDLKGAALMVMDCTVEYLIRQKRLIHPRTIQARNDLLRRIASVGGEDKR
ncbi:MAG TPA: HD domain-containing protein [Clostridia bacterium]|nr:HD domain-containing protein [Clostridia bacterium]